MAALLKIIISIVYIWGSTTKVTGILHGASEDELAGLFPEYEITIPTVVASTGEYISHNIAQAQSLTEEHYIKRRRRSTDERDPVVIAVSDDTSVRNTTTIDMRNDMYYDTPAVNQTSDNSSFFDRPNSFFPGQEPTSPPRYTQRRYLHFNVSAFGSKLLLKVEMKSRLIAPGAKSVVFTADGGRIERDLSLGCYFYGKIFQQPDSKVAISNCNGLAGLIKSEDDEFFIEPVESHFEGRMTQRHVIYRRRPRSENVDNHDDVGEHLSEGADAPAQSPSLADSLETMLNDNEGSFHRGKRHVKRNDYNIEVLLSADNQIVEFHGSEHVENYLLTLINIVDEIYHDSSLGEHINIVLSRLYQLDEERSNALILRDNPAVSLKNVCKWAHTTYESDASAHGSSPDHAIFLTRRKFGPAGYAHVAGMCQAFRSCSINFEDGFSSAFVVAHETGHVLGMEHDGEGNSCGDETSMGSIMAPLVQAAFHRYHWSRCSQQELQANLRNFACLQDDPHSRDWGPTPLYPGITYSMDDQCRFDFGQGYKRCTAFRNLDVCRTLWCSHDDNPLFCKTKKGPPVDGTNCGENMWCFRSHCVWQDKRYRPTPGSWGAWSAFSECTRSCGMGVKYRSRQCNNPAPMHGGNICAGRNINYDLCNKRACLTDRDFRADQCMYRNNEVEYKSQRHKWLPYEPLNPDLKCDLYCVSKKTNDVVTMGDFVIDGTQCSYDDPHGICIGGECVEVGCDKILGSSLRQDDCGVCGGDNSQCRNMNNRINKRTGRKVNAYMKLYRIPKGARHIRIEEISTGYNGNQLALKSKVERRYVLNAKGKLITESETPYQYVNAGALWTYESADDVETITTRGPINSDFFVMVLVNQRNIRLSVRCRYTIHQSNVTESRDTYRYEIKRWTPCSVTCGAGIRKAKYGCKSQTRRKWVNKKNCRGKPPRINRRGDNVQACNVECRMHASWLTGSWGPCTKSCGSNGIQKRNVSCHRVDGEGQNQVVNDRLCLAERKPLFRQTCKLAQCPSRWKAGPWSQCGVTCGEGTQRRHVFCRTPGKTASNPSECSEQQPAGVRRCVGTPCEGTSARPTTRPTAISTASSRRPPTTSEDSGCVEDKSVFCTVQAMDQYCKIPNYKNICCVSCRNYLDSQQGDGIGQKVLERPETIAFFSAEAINMTDLYQNSVNTEKSSYRDGNDAIMDEDATDSQSPASIDQEDIFSSETNPADPSIHNDEMTATVSDDRDALDGGMDHGHVTRKNEQEENEKQKRKIIPVSNSQPDTSNSNPSTRNPDLSPSNGSSRRRRFANQYVWFPRGKSDCITEGCGVGIRKALFHCWDVVDRVRVSESKCSGSKRKETVCYVPCYQLMPKSSILASQRSEISRLNSECRLMKPEGFGPRVKRSLCNGAIHRKTFRRTLRNIS